ncbi:MAG: RIP metalloprotease RseP [Lachnospiraceae bacterium]|nr:RIP metalloprotease RseP [Lachnospiraceae bacterium]
MRKTVIGAALLIAGIAALILTGHLNILLAILMIGLVICFHELGHYLIARLNGVKVKEFSLGMGPTLVSWKAKKSGTRWSIKLLPFGGSCLMLGDDEALVETVGEGSPDDQDEVETLAGDHGDPDETNEDAVAASGLTEEEREARAKERRDRILHDSGAFRNKSVWQRISIIFAGPFFNFILAFLLACIILGSIGYDPALVTTVSDEVASATGLAVGDKILEYEGHSITIGRDLTLYENLDGVPTTTITIKYEHEGKTYEKTYDSVYTKRYMCGIGYNEYRDGTVVPMTLTQVVGAAEAAGLKVGDKIVRFQGETIGTATDFRNYVDEHPIGADPVVFVVERDGQELTYTVNPILQESYSLGFGYNIDYREKVGPIGVIRYGAHEVTYWIKATIKSLAYMLKGKAHKEDVGGAVRIVSEMSNVVDESYKTDGAFYAFLNLINWAILLSANLGVMNLLPIPALDGGRLLFLFIEAIRGKKANPKVEGYVTLVGFILLMLLMVIILFNDISNVFGMILPR